jgi:hypothetical protein
MSSEGTHRVTIETVAEVMAVSRETLDIRYYPTERLVHLMADRYGELQSIAFPVASAGAVIAALQAIVDAGGDGS